jgi:hypothetical protein
MEQIRALEGPRWRARQTARILRLRQQKSRFRLHLEGLEQSPWRREYLRFWQRACHRHLGARLEWRQMLNRRLVPAITEASAQDAIRLP